MSLGETQMRPTAMLFRNLLAMEVEESIRGNPIDAVVLLGGCDKTTPGQLMGAASVDLPTIVVSSGTAFLVAFNSHSRPPLTGSAALLLIARAHVHGYDESFRFGSLMLFVAAVLFFALVNIDRGHLGQHDDVATEAYPAST